MPETGPRPSSRRSSPRARQPLSYHLGPCSSLSPEVPPALILALGWRCWGRNADCCRATCVLVFADQVKKCQENSGDRGARQAQNPGRIPRLRRVREEPVVEVGDLVPKCNNPGEPS